MDGHDARAVRPALPGRIARRRAPAGRSVRYVLMGIGLFNAKLALSEKGFYGMAFLLALFATVAIQKNVRDAGAAH